MISTVSVNNRSHEHVDCQKPDLAAASVDNLGLHVLYLRSLLGGICLDIAWCLFLSDLVAFSKTLSRILLGFRIIYFRLIVV